MSALQSVQTPDPKPQTPDLAVADEAVAETQASADALKLALRRLHTLLSVTAADFAANLRYHIKTRPASWLIYQYNSIFHYLLVYWSL